MANGSLPAENPAADQMSTRFFVIGCVLLGFAILLAIIGFAIRDLSPDQRQIIRWSFSLASGFAAGSFVGGFSFRYGVVPGIVATGTGGFAVWLVVYWTFFAPTTPLGPTPIPTSIPFFPPRKPTPRVTLQKTVSPSVLTMLDQRAIALTGQISADQRILVIEQTSPFSQEHITESRKLRFGSNATAVAGTAFLLSDSSRASSRRAYDELVMPTDDARGALLGTVDVRSPQVNDFLLFLLVVEQKEQPTESNPFPGDSLTAYDFSLEKP